jgi:hypothetical protein
VTNNNTPAPCSVSACASGLTCVVIADTAYCVECTEDIGCPSGTCVINGSPEDNYCSACASNIDCTSPEAPVCQEGACQGCQATDDCQQFADRPYCDGGTCVQCLEDSDCGGGACVNGTCKLEPGTADTCELCWGDQDCADGRICVPVGPEENRCFLTAPENGCAAPYVYYAETSVPFCAPENLQYGCTWLENYGNSCAPASEIEDCGVGGVCLPSNDAMTNGSAKCTYECNSDAACPVGVGCGSFKPGTTTSVCDI